MSYRHGQRSIHHHHRQPHRGLDHRHPEQSLFLTPFADHEYDQGHDHNHEYDQGHDHSHEDAQGQGHNHEYAQGQGHNHEYAQGQGHNHEYAQGHGHNHEYGQVYNHNHNHNHHNDGCDSFSRSPPTVQDPTFTEGYSYYSAPSALTAPLTTASAPPSPLPSTPTPLPTTISFTISLNTPNAGPMYGMPFLLNQPMAGPWSNSPHASANTASLGITHPGQRPLTPVFEQEYYAYWDPAVLIATDEDTSFTGYDSAMRAPSPTNNVFQCVELQDALDAICNGNRRPMNIGYENENDDHAWEILEPDAYT